MNTLVVNSHLPGANGQPVDKDTLRRVKGALEEYFINNLTNELNNITS